MNRLHALLAGAALLAATAAAAAAAPAAGHKFAEIAATRATLAQLQAGGFVLYLRHGPTDNTRPDRFPAVDLNDCGTQRPLTDEGRKMAAEVGEAMRRARIPVGPVLSSPLCRATETADAALAGQAYTVDKDLIYTANLTAEQKVPILSNTRRLLSAPVARGGNRLVIAHGPNLMDLIGYFPKEATLVVFRPKGEAGFEYVASVTAARWPELLQKTGN